jgi:hypothetical protein
LQYGLPVAGGELLVAGFESPVAWLKAARLSLLAPCQPGPVQQPELVVSRMTKRGWLDDGTPRICAKCRVAWR